MTHETVPHPVVARLARELAAIRVSQGWTQSGIARHMGIAQSAAYRVEHGTFHRWLPAINYADALGYDLVITVVPKNGDE